MLIRYNPNSLVMTAGRAKMKSSKEAGRAQYNQKALKKFAANFKDIFGVEYIEPKYPSSAVLDIKMHGRIPEARCVITVNDIEVGMTIDQYTGVVSDMSAEEESALEEKATGYLLRLNDKKVVDALLAGNAARFANHSSYPNCIFQYDRKAEAMYIVSIRDINAGEELTVDYGVNYWNGRKSCDMIYILSHHQAKSYSELYESKKTQYKALNTLNKAMQKRIRAFLADLQLTYNNEDILVPNEDEDTIDFPILLKDRNGILQNQLAPTLLQMACYAGDEAEIERLLENDADRNVYDSKGKVPISYVLSGTVADEVIKCRIISMFFKNMKAKNIFTHIADADDKTVLHYCLKYNLKNCASLLLKKICLPDDLIKEYDDLAPFKQWVVGDNVRKKRKAGQIEEPAAKRPRKSSFLKVSKLISDDDREELTSLVKDSDSDPGFDHESNLEPDTDLDFGDSDSEYRPKLKSKPQKSSRTREMIRMKDGSSSSDTSVASDASGVSVASGASDATVAAAVAAVAAVAPAPAKTKKYTQHRAQFNRPELLQERPAFLSTIPSYLFSASGKNILECKKHTVTLDFTFIAGHSKRSITFDVKYVKKNTYGRFDNRRKTNKEKAVIVSSDAVCFSEKTEGKIKLYITTNMRANSKKIMEVFDIYGVNKTTKMHCHNSSHAGRVTTLVHYLQLMFDLSYDFQVTGFDEGRVDIHQSWRSGSGAQLLCSYNVSKSGCNPPSFDGSQITDGSVNHKDDKIGFDPKASAGSEAEVKAEPKVKAEAEASAPQAFPASEQPPRRWSPTLFGVEAVAAAVEHEHLSGATSSAVKMMRE